MSNDRDYPASLDFDCPPHVPGSNLGMDSNLHTLPCILTDCKLSSCEEPCLPLLANQIAEANLTV